MAGWLLRARFSALFIASALVISAFLFLPAGTLDYWQAWAYLAVVLSPAAIVVAYFMEKDPAFIERRLRTREKEAEQALIIKLALPVFVIAFLIPGLDRRFGWSAMPAEVSIVADALVFLSYIFIFFVFRENSYAGRTVQVDEGQKVISTGPYSVVRHPMYLGQIVMYVATPLALGSYFAFPFFLLMIPIFVYRILNEEKVLGRDLPGYKEYCMKTRYRLIPHVW